MSRRSAGYPENGQYGVPRPPNSSATRHFGGFADLENGSATEGSFMKVGAIGECMRRRK
jgi:hypothetical protein